MDVFEADSKTNRLKSLREFEAEWEVSCNPMQDHQSLIQALALEATLPQQPHRIHQTKARSTVF